MEKVDTEGGREAATYEEIDLRTAADWGWRMALKSLDQNVKGESPATESEGGKH